LYLSYLDAQYQMIQSLQPFVVGHFDIIRIHDPDYESRFRTPEIWEKVERNLTLIKDLGLCMDYNLRPLSRGEAHAYPCPDILNRARQMEIPPTEGTRPASVWKRPFRIFPPWGFQFSGLPPSAARLP